MCDECTNLEQSLNRRRVLRLAGISAGGAIVAAAGLSWRGAIADAQDATPTAVVAHTAHWEYEGDDGPEHWSELDPAYASCSGGTQQSPIDISADTGADIADIEFSYQVQSPLHIINNGHTVQVNAAAGSSIDVDGVTYDLKQFHFHTPSEHTVNGVAEAMEMHLVHISADGAIAVVGVRLAVGAENAGLKSVFEAMPVMAGPALEVTGSVDPNTLLPASHETYRYMGSLTTPPCTEGVHWLLMTHTAEISEAQLNAYHHIFELDARPVQPLNDRDIEEDTSE